MFTVAQIKSINGITSCLEAADNVGVAHIKSGTFGDRSRKKSHVEISASGYTYRVFRDGSWSRD